MYTAVAGTRITADSRVPRDSWAATSRYRCSAANAEHQDLTGGDLVGGQLAGVRPDQDERARGRDDHDVVEDRGPHRRGEVTARVQNRREERRDSVEEYFRQQQIAERRRQVLVR